MKKRLILTAAIVLLLLLTFYGYLQFRQYSSYRQRIHQDASLILKLNLDGVFKSMSADFLSDPMYYLKEGSKPQIKTADRGFALPANIFIYTLKTKSKDTYFCSFPLTDTVVLKQYLLKYLKVQKLYTIGKGITTGTTNNGRLTVAYDKENFAISYSIKKERVIESLKELLDKQHYMADENLRIQELKKSDAHIAWTFKTYSGSIDFEDGKAIIDGTFPITGIEVPDQVINRFGFVEDAAVKVWLNAGLKTQTITGQDFQFKAFNLKADTLLAYYGNYIGLELSDNISQKDSVISYEYNDDFEKTAKTTIKEVSVPHLKINIAANLRPMLNYLEQQGIISVNGMLNKTLFPLYKVYRTAHQKERVLQLSTVELDDLSVDWKKSPYFFSAEIDFSKLKQQNQFPLLNNYILRLKHLQATAKKIDAGTGRLQASINFNRQNINAFTQLLN